MGTRGGSMFPRGQKGQAIAEFAIAFPLQLFITLGTIQLGLIYVGKQVVEYAAFCAARAEVVEEDPATAARIACTPITGSTAPVGGTQATTLRIPGWGTLPHSDLAADKTSVTVDDPVGDGNGLVRVTVAHDLELAIPVVGSLIESIVGMTGGGPYGVFASDTISSRYGGGAPHVRLRHTVELANPWEAEPNPAEVHPVPPGV